LLAVSPVFIPRHKPVRERFQKSYNEVATQQGRGFSSQINATIEIDSKHRATLKKVTRKEGFE
jgi:hypothetical protein